VHGGESARLESAMIELKINGNTHRIDADPQTPLAWVLRERLGLTGTKLSCFAGLCGACTVHLGDAAVRSCLLPASGAVGYAITTIEGLSPDGSHPVQRAWIEDSVVQCGYCQSGFIMAAAALLKAHPEPSDAQISSYLTNICRCGTYRRIRAAIHRAATLAKQTP
jgi:isoquinoline 1-oxidoreductase alpha subunit